MLNKFGDTVSVIELSCEEYGTEIIDKMVNDSENGRSLKYMRPSAIPNAPLDSNFLNGKCNE